MSRLIRISGLAALVLAISGLAYAFTAANTVPDSNAGDGTGDVNGYTISNIVYTTSGADVTEIDMTVTPDLGTAANNASVVQVSVNGGGFQSCSGSTASTAWNCVITPTPLLTLSSLRVVAAQ